MFDVLVAGHLCVDIIPQIPPESASSSNFLAPGRLTEVGAAIISTGGAVSNTGLALYKLGLHIGLVARLGDDYIGDLTKTIIQEWDPSLTEHLFIAKGEPSSYTIVINPPGIDRTFLHCPGTNNTFGPEDIPSHLLEDTRILHFGYPPLMRRMFADDGQELTLIFQRAKALGATTSLDMAMPDPTQPSGQADWPAILRRVLPYVDFFLPSVEELLYMLHKERYAELAEQVGPDKMIDALSPEEIHSLAQEVLGMGTKVLICKLGHRGLYLRSGHSLNNMGRIDLQTPSTWEDRELWAPCFKTQVVGTVGAGDATIAGFLAGLLRGQS
ncbi:MAG: carbohydrate kinase family protein, partial [Anaerolineae bacterium]|nr:carbohydrate kinase family protein [Anaerolineae bacterium]